MLASDGLQKSGRIAVSRLYMKLAWLREVCQKSEAATGKGLLVRAQNFSQFMSEAFG